MDEVERFEREYYEAYIAGNNKHREDPISLIHAIIDAFGEYQGHQPAVVERSIRRQWKNPVERSAMETEYEEYWEEQTRKLERRRSDPPALRHAINKAVGSLFGSVARPIETSIRYEWRDNPERRAEMERHFEAAIASTKKPD